MFGDCKEVLFLGCNDQDNGACCFYNVDFRISSVSQLSGGGVSRRKVEPSLQPLHAGPVVQ